MLVNKNPSVWWLHLIFESERAVFMLTFWTRTATVTSDQHCEYSRKRL